MCIRDSSIPVNPSRLTQAAPTSSGLLPISNIVSAAHCRDLTLSHASCAMNLLVSSAGTSFTPHYSISSSVPASAVVVSHCSPSVSYRHSGTESTRTKRLPVTGNITENPRLVIQPSFIVVKTQPEVSMTVVPSLCSTQQSSVMYSPPVSTRVQNVITFSDTLSYAREVSSAEFPPAYSMFTESISTLSSPINKPLPRIASSTECTVDPQLMCSPSFGTASKASSGK